MNIESQSPVTLYWRACLAFALCAVAALMPDFAFAQGDDTASVLCAAVYFISGPVGAAVATIAVVIVGLGALMGKVSWGMAVIIVAGIAIIFGATEIVDFISGTDGC